MRGRSHVPNRRPAGVHITTSITLALLAGCQQAPPATPAGELAKATRETRHEGRDLAKDGVAAPAQATSQRFTIDVDPVRAAAFERPTAPGGLQLMLDSPVVTHDLATNRTTVALRFTNAGAAIPDLRLRTSDGAPLAAGPGAPTALAAAGATQELRWVFDNPEAGSFSFDLDFAGTPGPRRALQALVAPSGATASSSYGTLGPQRAIDGDLATQWANDGYQAAEAWLRIDTGAVRTLGSVQVKMRPQSGGAYYRIETSSDGTTFKPVTGNLKNATWNLETKALPAGTQGRYVRLHFFNDPAAPEVRFSVFEVKVDGGGGTASPTPAPTATPTATPSTAPTVTPTPTAAPTATPTPAPVPSTAPGTYSNTFEEINLGGAPTDFIDPRDEGYSYSWMPAVRWFVVDRDGSKQFLHDGLASRSYLSFRRYNGTAFGANGLLPNRYSASVDVTPYQAGSYGPTGDQGTQFYYLDPTHYFELLVKPTLLEVWVANGAEPFTSANWQRLYYTSATTSGGQKRKLAVDVDTSTRTVRCWFDGQLKTTQTHAMITTQPHYFALRGAGNVVAHDNVVIQSR